jgi:hypothetical protein
MTRVKKEELLDNLTYDMAISIIKNCTPTKKYVPSS